MDPNKIGALKVRGRAAGGPRRRQPHCVGGVVAFQIFLPLDFSVVCRASGGALQSGALQSSCIRAWQLAHLVFTLFRAGHNGLRSLSNRNFFLGNLQMIQKLLLVGGLAVGTLRMAYRHHYISHTASAVACAGRGRNHHILVRICSSADRVDRGLSVCHNRDRSPSDVHDDIRHSRLQDTSGTALLASHAHKMKRARTLGIPTVAAYDGISTFRRKARIYFSAFHGNTSMTPNVFAALTAPVSAAAMLCSARDPTRRALHLSTLHLSACPALFACHLVPCFPASWVSLAVVRVLA